MSDPSVGSLEAIIERLRDTEVSKRYVGWVPLDLAEASIRAAVRDARAATIATNREIISAMESARVATVQEIVDALRELADMDVAPGAMRYDYHDALELAALAVARRAASPTGTGDNE